MRSFVADPVERLDSARSRPMLRLVDDAALGVPRPELPEAGVESYRWLLARAGDGVRLTRAGHLPPALVAETMQPLGWADDWSGKHNREDQTLPMLDLRGSAQRLGLLREHRGTLLPQARPDPTLGNPQGCWDWWGYLGPGDVGYATKRGPQMEGRAVRSRGGGRDHPRDRHDHPPRS